MGKEYSNKLFHVNDRITISCRSEGTRYGFRHLASLHVNGYVVANSKACYYNRTWDAYEFQSVILALAEKAGADKETIRELELRSC
jgi:hypothetical protein